MILLFDTDIAVEYGLREAIVLQCIYYWIAKNKANEKHYHDGRYWTYNSVSAYKELFPFLTEKQIRSTLDSLVDKGLIVKGNYNTDRFDKTSWYAMTDLGISICPQMGTRFALWGKPIPNNYEQITNTNNKEKEKDSTNVLSKEKENFDLFWSAYPKRKDKANAEKAFRKVDVPIETLLKAIEKQKKSADWMKEGGKYIPYPSTWLNGRRWEDETDLGMLHGRVNIDISDPHSYDDEEDRSEDLFKW